jgi:soluble lytic murein transglycosylase-like protein
MQVLPRPPLLHLAMVCAALVCRSAGRLRLVPLALAAVALSALRFPALAAPPLASPSQLCEAAIGTAERAERLPERMMGAIAVVETGRPDPASGAPRPWPWTINAEGQGFFFTSKQQAIEAVRTLQARGVRSIDVGCMQVNLMFHPNAFASLDQAFDPEANARYAARFLTALYGEHRDWPAAIAAYHSETPALGAAYRRLVMARWDRPGMTGGIVHYADFTPRSASYRDFLPNSQVYGAFANAIDARPSTAPLR